MANSGNIASIEALLQRMTTVLWTYASDTFAGKGDLSVMSDGDMDALLGRVFGEQQNQQ